MNTHPARAPLVATNTEDAANNMLSEGGPVSAHDSDTDDLVGYSWGDVRATVDRHPLSTLAVAFSVGFLAGIFTRH